MTLKGISHAEKHFGQLGIFLTNHEYHLILRKLKSGYLAHLQTENNTIYHGVGGTH